MKTAKEILSEKRLENQGKLSVLIWEDTAILAMEEYAEQQIKISANLPVIKSFCVCKYGSKKKNSDCCSMCGGKWKGRPNSKKTI